MMGLLFSAQLFSCCNISHPRSRKHPNVIPQAGNKTLSRRLGIDSNLTRNGPVARAFGSQHLQHRGLQTPHLACKDNVRRVFWARKVDLGVRASIVQPQVSGAAAFVCKALLTPALREFSRNPSLAASKWHRIAVCMTAQRLAKKSTAFVSLLFLPFQQGITPCSSWPCCTAREGKSSSFKAQGKLPREQARPTALFISLPLRLRLY